MSKECAYTPGEQFVVNDLVEQCRGLRTDVDNLLAEIQRTQHELTTLRARVNSNEMEPVHG